MDPVINFVAYADRAVSAEYRNLMIGGTVVLVDTTSGQQLPAPVTPIDLIHGSLNIQLPDSVKAGRYHLTALDPHGHFAAQSVDFFVN
jgi:hypothetical protein